MTERKECGEENEGLMIQGTQHHLSDMEVAWACMSMELGQWCLLMTANRNKGSRMYSDIYRAILSA